MSVAPNPKTGKENERFVWERQIRNACKHQLPSGARSAAYALSTHMDINGLCFVGAARLAKGMGKSITTAKRAKRALIDLGWVEITNGGDVRADGGFMASTFHALSPVLSPCQECFDPSSADATIPDHSRHQVVASTLPDSGVNATNLVAPTLPGSSANATETDHRTDWLSPSDQEQTQNRPKNRLAKPANPSIPDHPKKMSKGKGEWRRGIAAATTGGSRSNMDDHSTSFSQDKKILAPPTSPSQNGKVSTVTDQAYLEGERIRNMSPEEFDQIDAHHEDKKMLPIPTFPSQDVKMPSIPTLPIQDKKMPTPKEAKESLRLEREARISNGWART
jgi:hypothetical protein